MQVLYPFHPQRLIFLQIFTDCFFHFLLEMINNSLKFNPIQSGHVKQAHGYPKNYGTCGIQVYFLQFPKYIHF